MSFFKKLFKIVTTGTIFFVIDILYITKGPASKLMRDVIEDVQGGSLILQPKKAILAYVVIFFTLWYFVLDDRNNFRSDKLGEALTKAFMLGICSYGIYETNNYALFTNWDYRMVIIDMLWGGTVFTLMTAIYYMFIDNMSLLN